MSPLHEHFVRSSANHLRDAYLPRLDRALAGLDDDDLWWRPHAEITSIGNLLLHLEGNVRQWILSGLGGVPDHRERANEFAAREGAPKHELLAALRVTVDDACVLIESLDAQALAREHIIQDFPCTGLSAIYHVVEHFSWHTGQITWMAKLRCGEGHGISFYDENAINSARNSR